MLKGEKPRVCLRPVVVSNSREYVFLKTPALSTSEESKDRKLTRRSSYVAFRTSRSRMIFRKAVLKIVGSARGHFLIKLKAVRLQRYYKGLHHRCFYWKFTIFLEQLS